MQNFYTPAENFRGDRVTLEGDEYFHATRACRVRPGDVIGVTDGRGRRVEARIVHIDRSALVASVEHDLSGQGEPVVEITLALALIKPARFEIAVEKCTELGVRRILPVIARRCERDSSRLNADRLRRIALEAAKQSGRSWVPEILPPDSLDSVCRSGELILAALLDAGRRITPELLRGGESGGVTLLIGPEGDFSEDERNTLREAGTVAVSLGGLTLRAETAAIVAMALTIEALRG